MHELTNRQKQSSRYFKMKSLFKIFTIFALALSFACTQKSAAVVNRGKVVYDKRSLANKAKYSETARVNSEEKKSPAKLNDHEVEIGGGDTLYSIARKNNITLRDLIKENNLTPPYSLKSGDRLTIPTPTYHEVKTGDTLYSISRQYNMQVNQIIEINSLQEPYAIKLGEKIRVTKSESEKTTKPVAEEKKIAKVEEKKEGTDAGFVEKTLDRLNHFSWPVRGTVISKFGPKSGGLYNDGINIAAKEGDVVKASEDGTIAYVGNELKGYGNLIIVKHSGGWITAYAHLKDSLVKRGQKVDKGQKIGTVGSSGNVNSPQLYFGLRKGRDAINPENYLKN